MAILNENTTIGGLPAYDLLSSLGSGNKPIYGPVTTTGTGSAYIATIEDGPESLYVGLLLVIIPHTSSLSTTPTLNVNSLGAKRLYLYGDNNTSGLYSPDAINDYHANKPLLLMYDGVYFRVLNFNEVLWSNINGKPSDYDFLMKASSSQYATFSAIPSPSTNLNSSWAIVAGNASDGPVSISGHWNVIQMPGSLSTANTSGLQLAMSCKSDSGDAVAYIRYKYSGSWKSWVNLEHIEDLKEVDLDENNLPDVDYVYNGIGSFRDKSGFPGLLISGRAGNTSNQIMLYQGEIYTRENVSTESEWTKLGGSSGRTIKTISISAKSGLDTITDVGAYLVNDSTSTTISYYMMVSDDYNLGSTDRGVQQVVIGRMSPTTSENYQRYMIHRRTGSTANGTTWTWSDWIHSISTNENARYTSWSSLPPVTGTYRVYASSGAPYSSSNWAVSIYEVGSSTESPTTRYFIQLAMRNASSNTASEYDLYYRKLSHNGSSWSNGTWEKILTDNTATITTSLRTTASVTTASTTGYYRNIGVGTSAPSSLSSGQVFLVYEDA